MGKYFTVLADMIKVLIKSLPRSLRGILYLFYPILDSITKLDNLEPLIKYLKLENFHGGYFIILRK